MCCVHRLKSPSYEAANLNPVLANFLEVRVLAIWFLSSVRASHGTASSVVSGILDRETRVGSSRSQTAKLIDSL